MTDDELDYVIESIKSIIENHEEWGKEYEYSSNTNEFTHKTFDSEINDRIASWFDIE
jgi:hypothetical protein